MMTVDSLVQPFAKITDVLRNHRSGVALIMMPRRSTLYTCSNIEPTPKRTSWRVTCI